MSDYHTMPPADDEAVASSPAAVPAITQDQDARQLGVLLIKLLQGVLYQEKDAQLWNQLLLLQNRVQDQAGLLGLELIVDESESYAFLRTRKVEEEEVPLPRLLTRRQLSFPVSLLLALLRKKLAEFDADGGALRLVLSRNQIVDMIRIFLPENSNEARFIDQIDTHLGKVEEMGFVRKLKSPNANKAQAEYEVRRILKAFVDAQWLGEFEIRLQAYRQHGQSLTEDNDA